MPENKICPKCSQPMNKGEIQLGLPFYLEQNIRNDAISLKQALRLQPYICSGCRLVEVYAV